MQPIRLQAYSYAYNDPVRLTDRTGQNPFLLFAIALAGGPRDYAAGLASFGVVLTPGVATYYDTYVQPALQAAIDNIYLEPEPAPHKREVGWSPPDATATPRAEPNWVVRAGVATAQSLQRGSANHFGVPGLYGFSIQHQPGKTVHELAAAGHFPNLQISVTTTEQLIAAASRAGYTVRIVRSPGRGYHHTVEVPRPLPDNLAHALSAAFTQMPNPAPAAPRGRRP